MVHKQCHRRGLQHYLHERKGKVDSVKTVILINVASFFYLKISKLGAVAALAGRLFQLAVVRGKKLYWMNCLVITGS